MDIEPVLRKCNYVT